jgi:lipoprotein-releasing system ATP-binding protein
VETEVLHGIDLSLAEGEFAALIGPSGSGKSTLLNIIGLLERPTGGRLSIGGRDTASLSEAEITQLRGRSIGFVFQFHHLLPAFTALENVMMPSIIARGRPDDEAEATALSCSTPSASRPMPSRSPASCPAVSSSGWRSPVRWPCARA